MPSTRSALIMPAMLTMENTTRMPNPVRPSPAKGAVSYTHLPKSNYDQWLGYFLGMRVLNEDATKWEPVITWTEADNELSLIHISNDHRICPSSV